MNAGYKKQPQQLDRKEKKDNPSWWEINKELQNPDYQAIEGTKKVKKTLIK